MPTTPAARKALLLLVLILSCAPLSLQAATTSPISTVYLPWVPNAETIGGLGPWYGEVSFQNLSSAACGLTVYVGKNGSWIPSARLSVTAGAARTVGATTLSVPHPGAPVRLEAGCPLAASVKAIAPDGVFAPWSDGASIVTGYTGIAQADVDAAIASPTSAWFLPIAQTNSDWNTFIRVANVDDGGVDVTVELYPSGNIYGSAGADLVLTERLGIAEVWTIDTLYELGRNDWVGYARISVTGNAVAVALRTKASTTMALSNVAVAADAAATDQQHVAAAPLLFNAYNGWNTGINLANVSDEVAEVRVAYYPAGGALLREETVFLLPRSMEYIYTPGTVEQEGFVGGALIIADMPVVAAIDEVKYATTEGLSYLASGVAQVDAAIPLSFREDPHNGLHDNSGINVFNMNPDAAQEITITLVDRVGAPILPEPVILTLPPGGTDYVYLPFIDAFPPGTVASVRLATTDPLGFVAISNDINYVVAGDGSVVFSASSDAGYYRAIGDGAP